jgi:hypothetical protein
MNARQRRVTLRRLRREAARLGLKPSAWDWRHADWLASLIKRATRGG